MRRYILLPPGYRQMQNSSGATGYGWRLFNALDLLQNKTDQDSNIWMCPGDVLDLCVDISCCRQGIDRCRIHPERRDTAGACSTLSTFSKIKRIKTRISGCARAMFSIYASIYPAAARVSTDAEFIRSDGIRLAPVQRSRPSPK